MRGVWRVLGRVAVFCGGLLLGLCAAVVGVAGGWLLVVFGSF